MIANEVIAESGFSATVIIDYADRAVRLMPARRETHVLIRGIGRRTPFFRFRSRDFCTIMSNMADYDHPWHELVRTNDLDEALTIVTTIASMEFDVRWQSSDHLSAITDCEGDYGNPPYIIEVPADSLADLHDVLPDILDEQDEFEAAYCAKQEIRQSIITLVLIGLTLVPILFAMLSGLLQFGAERFENDNRARVVTIA